MMDYAWVQSPVGVRTRRDRPTLTIIVLFPLWLVSVIVPSIGTKENLDVEQFVSFAWLPIVAACMCRSRFLVGPLFRQRRHLVGLLVACVLALAASSLLSIDPLLSLGFVVTAGLGVVFCAGLWGAIGAEMSSCISAYAILGSALAGYAYYLDTRVQGRLTLGTAHPNFLGIMAFGLAITALTVRPRIFAALLVAGNIFIIIQTESRSALGAVLLALLAFAFLHAYQVRERRGALALIGVILCGVIIVALYYSTIEGWFSSLFFLTDKYRGLGTGFTGREGAWAEAIDLFMENPVFGVGFRMHERYMTVIPSAHNGYLSLLAETGVVGSAPLLVLTAILLWHLLRQALGGKPIAILGISFVTGYLFISFFERLFLNMGNPTSILVWIFLLAPQILPDAVNQDRVLFTSAAEARLTAQSFRPYRCKGQVVGLGTAEPPADVRSQLDAFYSAFGHLRARRIVLFLGRLHKKKGCDLLLQAFAPTAVLDPRLHLVVAGPDEDGLRDGFQKFVNERRIQDRITFTGELRSSAKWGAFRAAEAFALTSHGESYGNAVVEAMACGLPVLISDKVNISEEIASDRAGLIDSDTVEGSIRLLQRWAALSERERQTFGANARNCYETRYEINAFAKRLIDFIAERIGKPRLASEPCLSAGAHG